MDIRPIKTEADYQAALTEIKALWNAELGTPDGDRFEVISQLAHAYEMDAHPMPELDAVEYLKAHMANTGLTQADLADVIGSRSRASEILNRHRPLTLDMIRAICTAWHVSADSLVRQYELT